MTAQPVGPEYSGITELPASEARARLSELLDAVADGKFVYLTRHGRRVAALMPADIAENYERIEDDYWAKRADQASASDAVPWDQAIAELEAGGR
jgi:prevent-host-death family protein